MKKNEKIVIGMAMHNNAATVVDAVESVLQQANTRREVILLIADDNSTDGSYELVQKLAIVHRNILLLKSRAGSAARNRNFMQEYVKNEIQECVLMGRLDADDTLSDSFILQKIETLWDQTGFDVLLMSNEQWIGNNTTGHINRPHESLLKIDALVSRLQKMSRGVWQAELPSCNVFVRPQIFIPYPDITSAEDHWNLVDYLLQANRLQIQIRADWIYCSYRIDKHLSSVNHVERSNERKSLYKYALQQYEGGFRRQRALEILNGYQPGQYHYLGEGFSGVVFHDTNFVYKIHIPLSTNNFNEIDNILFLKEKLHLFHNRKHFYPLKELVKVEGYYLLIYPFEATEKVTTLHKEDIISFLSEMWKMKLVCRSITKENNFRKANGVLKLIDYEIEPYSDNLFLNLSARAFIQLSEYNAASANYNKLKRSTINHFSLGALHSFFPFVRELFMNIAQTEIKRWELALQKIGETKKVIYDGNEQPAVSLLIKACIQDSETIYNNVLHIVGQLTKAVQFFEIILLLDLYKEDQFIRQYTHKGSKSELLENAERLLTNGVINRILISPSEPEVICQLNKQFFGTESSFTHTASGVPLTSQLYAFREAAGEFILQTDCDILFGTKKEHHDYLQQMIHTLQATPHAVSAGFQIYHNSTSSFQEFVGQEGAVPPDVRCCLLQKHRLFNQFPLPNRLTENGWELSWYRALEKKQLTGSCCSLRGGDTDTFYIHIQNYRKVNRKLWWQIQQAVANHFIPQEQNGKPETAGSIFEWSLPKRTESLVVLILLQQPNETEWHQTISSVLFQDQTDFGMIIINNSGNPGAGDLLRSQLVDHSKQITIINYEKKMASNEAIYDAVHHYVTDPDSFVCLLKQGDILLYEAVLSECMNRLSIYGADVLTGKEISETTLEWAGMSKTNFLQPRQEPESFVNGLIVFRKYLFDTLTHFDLKIQLQKDQTQIANYGKLTKAYKWLDDLSFLSITIPVIEMSTNPIRFDHFNLLRNHPSTNENMQKVVGFLKSASPKAEGAWEKGRKTFIPNTNRIELDITYECNLKCLHCNRSCTQAPADTHMTVSQIETFINESIALNKKWELINVLGGEPTLHPQFQQIIEVLLRQYIIPFSPATILQVTSNGYGPLVKQQLQQLPKHPNLLVNENSFKTNREIPYFTPFNLAPVDDQDSAQNEFHKGCWVTSYCGIGLNHLGYFACGVAGGIERILKADGGIQHLKDVDELISNQLNTYCRYCGNFSAYAPARGDFMDRSEKEAAPKTAMSATWKALYKSYNNDQQESRSAFERRN